VILPGAPDLIVSPIARMVSGNSVTDDISIIKQSDHKVSIVFKTVAPTTETYKWQILNLKNPPSTKPSSKFLNLIVRSSDSAQVQSYQKEGPHIQTQLPAEISIFNLN
jgi:hypothetical protein